ncbi:hypothetical protein SteCoe_11811 [Stentor coeruleus]|uniref:Uncharacterized protein n=1 Tax=Stentor coeruleus TaxID=5963 RepID=A0A1R2CC71_9CILI|nr:hypothetical protein SteCoe_11811 [Stentor coeruleus]
MESSNLILSIKTFIEDLSKDETNTTLNNLVDCFANLSHIVKSKELKRQFCYAKDQIKNNKQSAIQFLIQFMNFIDNTDNCVYRNINNIKSEIVILCLQKKSSLREIRHQLTKDFKWYVKIANTNMVFSLYDNKDYTYKAILQEKFIRKSQVIVYRKFFQLFRLQFYAIGNLIVKVHEHNRNGLVLHVFKGNDQINYCEQVFNKTRCFFVVRDNEMILANRSALKRVEISWWEGCWIFSSNDEDIGRYLGNPFEESFGMSMPFAVEEALEIRINGESYCLRR